MNDITIKIWGAENREILARRGEYLRDILLKNGVALYQGAFQQLNCRGLGVCGSCKVYILENQGWVEKRSCQIQCYRPFEIQLKISG